MGSVIEIHQLPAWQWPILGDVRQGCEPHATQQHFAGSRWLAFLSGALAAKAQISQKRCAKNQQGD